MEKRILRVFPHRNNYTPNDDMVRIGFPDMLPLPDHDEVHISCTFTWDKELCEQMKLSWEMKTDKPVLLGGVAYGSPVEGFTPGMYIAKGVTFTSRGCNNQCPWCCVPRIEGKLVELDPFAEGNIIQDNNFLQCSEKHKDKVFDDIVDAQPTIDAVPVVRCKDCKWWTKAEASLQGRCALLRMYPTGGWFCADGERKDDE